MTAPKHPPFPASLTMPDDLRRPLLRLTTDGRARIVYDVRDDAQPMPHVAVVLAGRRLVAWVTATGWEDDTIEAAGATWSETIEALVPCGGADDPVRHIGGSTGHLAALVIHRVARGPADEHGYPTDARRVQWQRHACEELTRAVGMVEVLRPNYQIRTWECAGVLVPGPDRAWTCVREEWAVAQARAELRVPLHTDLVSRRGWLSVVTPVGAGQLQLEAASDVVRQDGGPPVNLLGLTSITLEGVPHVTLEARRGLRDFTWTVSLDARVPGRAEQVCAFRAYPRIVDGADALAMVKEIARTFAVPEPVPAAAEETPAAQRAFGEVLAATWNRRRRLQFVLDAAGITDTVQPPQAEAPREVTTP